MQKNTCTKMLQFCIVFVGVLSGCSGSSVPKKPEKYEKIIIRFVNEMEKLEAISAEEKGQKINGEVYKGMICLERRSEFFSNNKDVWEKLFADLEQMKNNLKTTDWHDDILFCLAIGYLKVSGLSETEKFTDNAISSISEFISINDNAIVEEWTKKKLKTVFWNSFATYFSETVSEKENINQFFYIARASLWENKKNKPERAIEDYNKALNINPYSLWGKQAQNQIKFLRERVESE